MYAKTYFKNLGYTYSFIDNLECYRKDIDYESVAQIIFDYTTKTVKAEVWSFPRKFEMQLTDKEKIAITKRLKELGWKDIIKSQTN